MMRAHRLLSFAAAAVVSGLLAPPALAQDAAPAGDAAAPVAAPAADSALPSLVRDFWHYASIAQYDAAKDAGEKILASGAQPRDILAAFEAAVADRNRRVRTEARIDLYERLLAWQRIPQLKDISAKLLEVFTQAKGQRRAEPQFITQAIERLSVSQRGYTAGLEQLRQSGELAVPIMLAYLKDPSKKIHHTAIRNALRDMGQRALNPLLAATEGRDWELMPWIFSALADLGYDNAIPFIARVAQEKETPEAVKNSARQALIRLDVADPSSVAVADGFMDLAEKLYYEKSSIVGDRGSPTSHVWFWNNGGLTRRDVPTAVFNEHMTLRATETVLQLDETRSDAVSLWLSAAYRREVELPEGGNDPIWTAEHPNTHYYATYSGTRHLNPALARALNDRNSALALKAVQSLQEIAGTSSLFAGDGENPLLDALRYPDRRIRFEAAFAAAEAMPEKAFTGSERVVPILAEAVSQSGRPGVIVVASSPDELNRQREAVSKNYAVQGGVGAEAAVSAAGALPAVDVIIVRENDRDIDRLFAAVRDNVRLERAAIVVLVGSEVASPYASIAATNPQITVSTAADDAALLAAIENARKRAGGLPIDEKLAGEYALRAAQLLERLALSRQQALDLSVAQSTLLGALDDARPEIARAAGNVLAHLSSKEAQNGLAAKAVDEKTADELKLAFLANLATSAKLHGNHVEPGNMKNLSAMVEGAASQDLRSAAAEAHGALNPSADLVKALILNHRGASKAAAKPDDAAAQPAEVKPVEEKPAEQPN
jgi:hypothetical protein